MKVRLEYATQESKDIRSYHFRPEKKLDYTAGQFIELTLPHSDPDIRGTKHWFTLSSSPTEELLAITTRHAVRSSSFKTALLALNPGDELHISEAMGDFVLPKDSAIPLIFIAGGIGITPYRSMIKWLTDKNEIRDIQMLYATHNADEHLYEDALQAYGLKPLIRRSLNLDDVLALPAAQTSVYYMAGPEAAVEQLTKALIASGVNPSRVITDYFLNYAQI